MKAWNTTEYNTIFLVYLTGYKCQHFQNELSTLSVPNPSSCVSWGQSTHESLGSLIEYCILLDFPSHEYKHPMSINVKKGLIVLTALVGGMGGCTAVRHFLVGSNHELATHCTQVPLPEKWTLNTRWFQPHLTCDCFPYVCSNRWFEVQF